MFVVCSMENELERRRIEGQIQGGGSAAELKSMLKWEEMYICAHTYTHTVKDSWEGELAGFVD